MNEDVPKPMSTQVTGAAAINPVAGLADALLAELATQPEPVSMARLSKKLGARHSSLLRCLAYLGEQRIGQEQGLGWVHAVQDGDRTMLALTEKGRAACIATK
ncbi:hypothetical protein LPB67_08280 [Undibacterium sp. Jales W-56]|uniref:hypothetical protein n=1 Tax=Undibacterium sp. Jales W-56 TaxID=2897325 RepID=UPI0021D388AC|nr:hypothetical protein [Undibacterium sp. Jales W-56]MCU6433774.1 hypothetical protein [Undibacterium sp. Jales W-56]